MELKLKVEKVETTTRGGKSIQFSGEWTICDQHGAKWNGNGLFTGKAKDGSVVPFPDTVVVGATVDCTVEEVVKGTSSWWALQFPQPGQAPQQTGSTWKGGRQEDVELKLVSFAMSYAKDLFSSTPESTLEDMFITADKILDKMVDMYKRVKG